MRADKNRRVLVIDDNRSIHDDFRKILSPATDTEEALDATEAGLFGQPKEKVRQTRFEVDSAYQGEEGLRMMRKALDAGQPYAMAFIDVRMPPGWDGVETTRKIWEFDPNLQVVLCTAYSDYSWDEVFENLAHRDGLLILKKPFDSVEAFQMASALTEKWWLHQEARRRMEELEGRVAKRTAQLQHSNDALQTEVAEHQRAAGMLRESNEKFLQLADNITDAFWITSPDLRTTYYVSSGYERIWGRSAESLYADRQTWIEAIHPEDRARVGAIFATLMAEEPTVSVEYLITRPDGAIRWVHDRGFQVRDPDGKLIRLTGVVTDITERKETEEKFRRQQAELRVLFDFIPAMICFKDTENRILRANQRLADTLGKTVAEIEEKPALEIFPEAATGFYEDDLEVIRSRVPKLGIIEMFRDRENQEIWIQTDKVPVCDSEGGVIGLVAMAQDITERRRAEEELRWKTAFLEAQVNSSIDGILVVDPQGKKILQNQRLITLMKIPQGIVDDQDDEKQRQWVKERTRDPAQFIARVAYLNSHPDEIGRDELAMQDGTILDRYSSPVVGEDGKYYGRIWTFRDVTERKRTEASLRESNEKFLQLANNITDAFWIRSPDLSEVHYISPAFERIWGRTVESLRAQPHEWVNFIFPEDRQRVEAAFAALVGNTPSLDIEYRIVRPDGEVRWVRVRGFQVRDAADQLIRHTGIVTDVTQRRMDVEKLRESKRFAESIAENSTSIIYLYDLETRSSVYSNRNAAEALGYSHAQVVAMGDSFLPSKMHPEDLPRILQQHAHYAQVTDNRIFDLEFRLKDASGNWHWMWSRETVFNRRPNGAAWQVLGSAQDITERKRLEAQLLQSQKLETVGKLAGGVAHEFNSILTAIIGQSELVLGNLPVGSPLVKNATAICRAADRAATLTRQLLAYGRKQTLLPEMLDLNSILQGMVDSVRHLMARDTEVSIAPAVGLKTVSADAGQIEHVIMSLALNAHDAMPNGGKLMMETANVSIDQESVGRYPDLKPGDYVMLAITDTGTGMSPEVKARAFEPFFTTKGVGEGSGLGLSTCYGIIKQSGGHINVYTELGRGTTFKIYLPQVELETKVSAPRPASSALPGGTETILLVEDDPDLREMAATLLRQLGYTVLAAANGIEALALKQHRDTGHIDLLFTDVVMPHMSGKELADRVGALYAHTRILFTSAYTENTIVHQGVLDKGVALLPKPFTPSALAHKLREVLDQPNGQVADAAQVVSPL